MHLIDKGTAREKKMDCFLSEARTSLPQAAARSICRWKTSQAWAFCV
jgi:hypothetical protein